MRARSALSAQDGGKGTAGLVTRRRWAGGRGEEGAGGQVSVGDRAGDRAGDW